MGQKYTDKQKRKYLTANEMMFHDRASQNFMIKTRIQKENGKWIKGVATAIIIGIALKLIDIIYDLAINI